MECQRLGQGGRLGSALSLALFWTAAVGYAGDLSRLAREDLAKQAEGLYTEGRLEPARQKWNEALAGGASLAERRRWKPWVGRTFESEGDYQRALAAYQEAYDTDPENVDRMVDLARLYDVVGIDEQAVYYYSEAHRRQRGRRDVALALARLHRQAGRIGEAQTLAEAAVRAEPRDVSSQELLAEIEESQGRLQDAARRRETVLGQKPSAQGYLTLGRLWAKQDAFEQADIAFSRAEQTGWPGPEARFERMVLAWRQGDRPRASLLLDQTARMDPAYFPTHFFRILLAMDAGNATRAEDLLADLEAPDALARKLKETLGLALSARSPEGYR